MTDAPEDAPASEAPATANPPGEAPPATAAVTPPPSDGSHASAPGEAPKPASEAPKLQETDVRNLQDKFHGLLDARNEYNDLAKGAREERDLLNGQRRERSSEIQSLRDKRDALNGKMREHKERRNAFQDQAKALIQEKRGQTGALERSLPLRVRKLRGELQDAVERQQTSELPPHKEKVLVEEIRAMWLDLKELEGELSKQKAVEVDLSDTDQAIDALFAKADEEHDFVSRFMKEAQEFHEKFIVAVKEMRILAAESDQKHKEFIAYKIKADEAHNKAMELREKVMSVRTERREAARAARAEIKEHNRGVHRNVLDERGIERAKQRSLDDLKKGGKITLGGW